MASTYYDSQLTAAEIEAALEAISGVIDPANNGKILAIEDGFIVPQDVSDYVDLNLQAKTVSPGASQQVVSPDSGYNGLSTVTVTGDANLVAGNIKKYVTIFGVTGSLEGGGSVISGTDVPDPSLGNDGDLYRRSFPIPQNVEFYEYLRNNNGAYINTGIYATQDIDIVAVMNRSMGTNAIGVRTGSFTGMTKAIYIANHTDYSDAVSCVKTGTSSVAGTIGRYAGKRTARTTTIKDNSGYYVYSSTIDELPTYSKLSRQSGTWTSEMPICLFSFYQGTSLQLQTATGVISRCTILENNVPVADYLPCKDGNGVACMYDIVSGNYLYNDNADSNTYFTVENAVNPTQLDDIYYIKKSGAWIALV